MQRRDERGRFAGSGAIGASTRSTSTGSRARRSAATVKAEISGAKSRTQREARDARRSGSPAAAQMYAKNAAKGKQKIRKMQRERRSLLRRSMRGV